MGLIASRFSWLSLFGVLKCAFPKFCQMAEYSLNWSVEFFATFKAFLKEKIGKCYLGAKIVRLRFLTNNKNVYKYQVHLFLIFRFSLCYLKTAKNWHPLIYLRVCNTYFHCLIKKPRSDIFQINIFWMGLLLNPVISWKIHWGDLEGRNKYKPLEKTGANMIKRYESK